MTDREIRSLSKVQILDLLRQQEAEIERLNVENQELRQRMDDRSLKIGQTGSLAEAAFMLSGIMQAAQDTANLYLDNIKATEEQQKEITSQVEREAKERAQMLYFEAERHYSDTVAKIKQVISDIESIFDLQQWRINAARIEFFEMVQKSSIASLIKPDAPVELKP